MTVAKALGAIEFTTTVRSTDHVDLPEDARKVLTTGQEVRVVLVYAQREVGTADAIERDMAEGYAALGAEHLNDTEFYLRAQSEVVRRGG